MSDAPPFAPPRLAPDWELDYYSRPIVEPDGRKRWELLICSTPDAAAGDRAEPFRWVRSCPASSVNSAWLREALQQALDAAAEQGFGPPRRLRCWRPSMRTMVQRAAEGLGMELVPSRRCYSLVEWLREREATVYPAEEGYLQGPLAPPPSPIRPVPVALPEAARGDSWSWVTLPAGALADAPDWDTGFASLLPLPEGIDPDTPVAGLRLISRSRALPIAGWVAGLEPVRLEIDGDQLVLEAGLEDRWRIASLSGEEPAAAAAAFALAREQAAGLQFLVVQAGEDTPRLEGFWMLRDLPDG
ncbi:MAG: Tab2 family RNA-binding protein [Cyanobacteriota bacterium]|nr:Tab2 family RNA-binding protein [Cyanobacteriota bacterium]